jgi:hypothetical protein
LKDLCKELKLNGKLHTELKETIKHSEFKYMLLDYKRLDSKIVDSYIKSEIDKYLSDTETFYKEQAIEIRAYKEAITFNYFKMLNSMYDYAIVKNSSISTVADFRRFATRSIELAIVLQSLHLRSRDIFFKEESFYENLLNIYQINFSKKILVPNLEGHDAQVVESEIQIHSDGVFITEAYHYISKSPVSRKGKGTKKSLAFFLKLNYQRVNDLYFGRHKDRSKDGGGGTAPELESLDPYPKKVDFERKIIKKTEINEQTGYDSNGEPLDNDELSESVSKSDKRILDEKGDVVSHKYVQQEYNKYIHDSEHQIRLDKKAYKNNFKKNKIATAIAHLQTKENLNLPSKYSISNINLLKRFLASIDKKECMQYRLMISSILLGIEPRYVLTVLMGVFRDMRIVNREYLRIDLTTAYAVMRESSIYKPRKKDVEVLIPATLLNLLRDLEKDLFKALSTFILEKHILYGEEVKQDFATCKTSKHLQEFMQKHLDPLKAKEINTAFLDEQNKLLAKYLEKNRKKFNKRVVVTVRYLHLYSFHYFSNIHRESNINLLFLKNKTANIHTMLTYVASTRQLVNLTNWIKELTALLGIDCAGQLQNYKIENIKSGSNKYIEPKDTKTVFSILSKIEMKNSNARLTVKMLYIRYVFSILFATRKYHFSASVKEYSKRKKILMIHEKAKDVYQSKRVIPVTALGSLYIQYFEQIRIENNIEERAPVVVDDDGKIDWMSNENITKWVNDHSEEIKEQLQDDEFIKVYEFITTTILDFGRHIFATTAHNDMELAQDYTDAFLNHFKRGTQDQGIYSLFDNKDYFEQVRNTLETIEKKYIPYWSEIKL